MKKYLHISLIIFVLLLSGCSDQKNTFISRSYHNLTAHYNVLFNGNESYKKGVERYNAAYRDDYSRILPVFNYGDKELSKSISSEMDVTQKKASKLITLHSIKAKPKMKRGKKLSPREKEMLNINEFNKWVDDAYLNIGRANFYLMDFDKSLEAFNFTVREFPKSNSAYLAQIWIARIYCEKGDYKEAEKILGQLELDKKFPKKLNFEYFPTVAHIALKQDKYPQALKALEKALPLTKKRKTKIRYMFILAQLYQQQNQYDKAAEIYTIVIRKNPSYEMTFNARINLASMVHGGSRDSRAIRQQLYKMSRDAKNADYLDQIYYALGNVEMNDGNTDKAIENYKQSVVVSKNNNDQKALSCLTLANFYYSKKDYLPAQAYYDSTVQVIDTDYPNIKIIKARAESLGRLVENLNTIYEQDSLLKIAAMSESERFRLIDKIISDKRKKEMEAQLAESQRLQDYYREQSRQLPGTQGQGKWYFYNPVTVNQGVKEFQLRWGKRKLEDNWRRKDKKETSFAGDDLFAIKSQQDKDSKGSKDKISDEYSREFYLTNIPFTDSLKAESKRKIIDAYFGAGLVYRSELMDLQPSADIYEQMLERFPESEYKLPVYYQLYTLYNEMGKTGKSDYYKNLILSQFPNSTYAQVITNPEFYKQIEEKDKEAERLYEQTYELYNKGTYSQVIANADMAIKQYPTDKTIPNFQLIRALSFGKTSDMLIFREELNNVVSKYPNHAVASHAKEVLAFLNTYKPETKQMEDVKKAEATYLTDDSRLYYCVIVLNKTEDLNQVTFDIINFNLDNFSNDRLEITREDLGKDYKIICIKPFTTITKVKAYYGAFMAKTEVLKNIKAENKPVFYISQQNFEILTKQSDADTYIQFFRIHFLETNPASQ